jgi:hypothetical protein
VISGQPTSLLGSISAATYQPHTLNPVAAHAAVLDYIVSPGIGIALLNPHRLCANDAVQEIDQGAFVVVQWTFSDSLPPSPSALLPLSRQPIGLKALVVFLEFWVGLAVRYLLLDVSGWSALRSASFAICCSAVLFGLIT